MVKEGVRGLFTITSIVCVVGQVTAVLVGQAVIVYTSVVKVTLVGERGGKILVMELKGDQITEPGLADQL